MKQTTKSTNNQLEVYPHHIVIREMSVTTKFIAVINWSKFTIENSLMDEGPNPQMYI